MSQNNFDPFYYANLVSDVCFKSTCYHSPPLSTTLGIWHCFLICRPILHPWVQKKGQFPNPRSPIYLNYFCMCNKKGGNTNCCTIEKMNIFSRTQHFLEFTEWRIQCRVIYIMPNIKKNDFLHTTLRIKKSKDNGDSSWCFKVFLSKRII